MHAEVKFNSFAFEMTFWNNTNDYLVDDEPVGQPNVTMRVFESNEWLFVFHSQFVEERAWVWAWARIQFVHKSSIA